MSDSDKLKWADWELELFKLAQIALNTANTGMLKHQADARKHADTANKLIKKLAEERQLNLDDYNINTDEGGFVLKINK